MSQTAYGELYYYRAYGFLISSDRFIGELQLSSQKNEAPDIQLYFQISAPGIVVSRQDWKPHTRFVIKHPSYTLKIYQSEDEQYHCLQYGDTVQFVLDKYGEHIYITFAPEEQDVAVAYLINAVIGFVLRLRGLVGLHASAINIDNEAILIAGYSGAGKSTLAALFATAGYPIIADDISVIVANGERMMVHPGYPRLRLLPDAVERFSVSDKHVDAMPELWSKYYLHLNDNENYSFANRPYPVRAVYILQKRGTDIDIEPIAPQRALPVLMDMTYMNYLLDNQLRAQEFMFLGQFVQSIAARMVTSPRDIAKHSLLYDALRNDLQTMLGDPVNQQPVVK